MHHLCISLQMYTLLFSTWPHKSKENTPRQKCIGVDIRTKITGMEVTGVSLKNKNTMSKSTKYDNYAVAWNVRTSTALLSEHRTAKYIASWLR